MEPTAVCSENKGHDISILKYYKNRTASNCKTSTTINPTIPMLINTGKSILHDKKRDDMSSNLTHERFSELDN
jgi:hypothetical protein